MYQVERQVANNYIQEHLHLTKRHSCKFLRKKGKKKKIQKAKGKKGTDYIAMMCYIC